MKPEERERLTQAIVADHWGIYGAEVCQVCGEIGVFCGYFGALGSHSSGEFLCARHHHPEEEREMLKERGYRFCEQCLVRVSRGAALRVGHHWLCQACASDPKERDEGAAYPLRELSKRRYLDRLSEFRC